jgi:hypothetical protein
MRYAHLALYQVEGERGDLLNRRNSDLAAEG